MRCSDYHLAANPADLQNFRQEARDLKTWLQTKKAGFATQAERDALPKLEAAYGDFLARVDPAGADQRLCAQWVRRASRPLTLN